MSELVKVLDKQIEKIEYKGLAVLTLAVVDDLHKKPGGTARRLFNYHTE